VEIRVLGPLEVALDGGIVALPGRKVRVLLAALIVHAGEVLSTDRLYEILWGAQPPATAANTLQTYVAHLRKGLEPERPSGDASRVLVTRQPGYLLAVDADDVDARRFERLARAGHAAVRETPAEAAATLRSALSLWRGDPLADVTYEPFAQAEIVRLTELRLAALEDRVDADLALGEHASLCGELAELVGAHPLRERLWGQFMTAHYRCGRQADALEAYGRLRELLVEQLGIEPSPALRELQAAVLQQRPELDWPPHPDVLPAPGPLVAPATPATSEPPATDVIAVAPPGEAPDAAGEALSRRDWALAFALFSAADSAGELDGDGLNGLAEAALWTGRVHESLAARQRAHAAFVADGATRRAAGVAITLSLHHAARLHVAVAGGWWQRAQRLLDDEPESVEHGFLAWAGAMFAVATGDDEAALAAARRAYDLGCRFGVPDLQALGLTFQGYVAVRQGRVAEGVRLLDEGMTWAVGGDLAPLPSALIFCRTISTCYELGDYRRAAEWMDAIADCFARTGIAAFPGDCEAHRLGILIGRGAWSQCELEARRACGEVEAAELNHVGLVLAELGAIHLRTGDLAAAEEAFSRAASYGHRPQPGLALLRLARGEIDAAADSIAAALAEESWNRLARSRLVLAQVEIAVAAGDVATARAASSELSELATTYAGPALVAGAELARGAVELADGDDAVATTTLRRAVRLWTEASAPYDGARTRLLLARALARMGERSNALAEVQAARVSLEALGAHLELQHANELADELQATRVRAET
jgi:DNA-binding SARP family transcriptional activator